MSYCQAAFWTRCLHAGDAERAASRQHRHGLAGIRLGQRTFERGLEPSPLFVTHAVIHRGVPWAKVTANGRMLVAGFIGAKEQQHRLHNEAKASRAKDS